MAILRVSTTFVDCEFESDLNLNFGSKIVAYTRDSGKYWRVINNSFVQTTLDGDLFFIQSLTNAQLRATPIPVVLSTDRTYSASASAFVCAAAATDIFEIKGSATKIIQITKIVFSGTTSAGSGISVSAVFAKRSTANTAGTFVTLTNVPHDSLNAAATAVCKSYTANPTLGTLVGNMFAKRITVNTNGTLNQNNDLIFSDNNAQPITLRGVNESLSINLSGATITGSIISCYVEWEEI